MKTLRESLTALGVFGPAVWLALIWSTLPARLPSHFGMDGMPNAYASRTVVWAVAGISVAMYLSLLLVQKFPGKMNLPRPVGDPDRPRVEALGVEMIGWLRLELAWTFAYMLWSIEQVGTHHREGLGVWFLFASMGLTMATLVWFLVKMKRPAGA